MKPPFTAEEIQQKLRSGELKIVGAPQTNVNLYGKEVDQLLLMIGECISDDAKGWADSCFVSDQSQLSDVFPRSAPEYLNKLIEKLGFPVTREMYLYEVAARMHGVQ